jgi:tRNA-intron endonuclease, archaea type
LSEAQEEKAETFSVSDSKGSAEQSDIQQPIGARYSNKLGHVVLDSSTDASLLQSKGFGSRSLTDSPEKDYFLFDYEVLYLMYTGKLILQKGKSKVKFNTFANFATQRDENAWTRFLIFRDLRTRGYVVREGFGFPIDFRVYDRGDYGTKAAKYIVFGLTEGKAIPVRDLKKNIEDMARMGKESVVAVVERRGEVIYYKIGKWYPIKSL